MIDRTFYVSITGLQLKKIWHVIPFYWYASRSFRQARRAPGNIRAEGKKINGVHHTLTVWENQEMMRSFLYAGPHMGARKAFHRFATGKTFGFETNRVPPWDEVHAMWHEHGRDYS